MFLQERKEFVLAPKGYFHFSCTILVLVLANSWKLVESDSNSDDGFNRIDHDGVSNILQNQTAIASIKPWTLEDCSKIPEDWIPPFNLSTRFKTYLSGYDDDHRPIWIVEIGTWDLRSIAEGGEEQLKAFEKYALQLCGRLYKYSRSEQYPDGEGWAIFDADGLDIRQFTSLPTVALTFRMGISFRKLMMDHITGIVGINVNFPARLLYSLARPFAGTSAERIELLGNNRAQWIPRLLQRFPKEQLPPWYGGTKNFKPVAVLG